MINHILETDCWTTSQAHLAGTISYFFIEDCNLIWRIILVSRLNFKHLENTLHRILIPKRSRLLGPGAVFLAERYLRRLFPLLNYERARSVFKMTYWADITVRAYSDTELRLIYYIHHLAFGSLAIRILSYLTYAISTKIFLLVSYIWLNLVWSYHNCWWRHLKRIYLSCIRQIVSFIHHHPYLRFQLISLIFDSRNQIIF